MQNKTVESRKELHPDRKNISELYRSGMGCVKISMTTGLSMERVMGILCSELGNVHLRMRGVSPSRFHSSL